MAYSIRIVLALIASIPTIGAFAGELTVRMEPPSLFKHASGDLRWDVFLEGEIDSQAPERVRRELAKLGESAEIHLDSPGGNLLAGLELGKVIRKSGSTTSIDKRVGGMSEVQPGKCLSACSLAFLGGVYRYAPSGSVCGVHRVSSTSGPSSTDLDVGQILSAAITNYIREMDVEPALFDRMVRAGTDELYVLTPDEMKALQVVNNGRKRAVWSIETTQGLQYLRGAQDTVRGMGKALFYCKKGSLMFHSIYQAGPMASTIVGGEWVHSLMISNSPDIPLPSPVKLDNDNGYINALFPLTRDQVRLLYTATSVGHAMQISRKAPTFVGYNIDIDQSASKRVRGFIDSCFNPL